MGAYMKFRLTMVIITCMLAGVADIAIGSIAMRADSVTLMENALPSGIWIVTGLATLIVACYGWSAFCTKNHKVVRMYAYGSVALCVLKIISGIGFFILGGHYLSGLLSQNFIFAYLQLKASVCGFIISNKMRKRALGDIEMSPPIYGKAV